MRALLAATFLGCVASATSACHGSDQPIEKTIPGHSWENRLSQIGMDGARWIDEKGEVVHLQGVNLGNWFLWEPWMFGWFWTRDQHSILEILRSRFGAEVTQALVEQHWDTWITEDDFERIASWGFNVVRLPFHYHLIENSDAPGVLCSAGVRRLIDSVEMAEQHGLYTILDFHGAPGGQSTDAPTGRIDQNRLWYEAEKQERFIALWTGLAEVFKGSSAIAALDILNEPFGAGTDEPIEALLVDLFDRVHTSIRATGNETILLAPGTLRGVYFWPSPRSMGWTSVGITDHFYPGVFGGEPTLDGHGRVFGLKAEGINRLLEEWEAPFLVGEFNPIFNSAGGTRMLIEHFDRYAAMNWAATMWTYKMITPEGGIPPENWPLLTNGRPLDTPDPRVAPLAELEALFSGQLFRDPVEDEEFLRLWRQDRRMLELELPALITPASRSEVPEGWALEGIGFGTQPPVVQPLADDSLALYGSGFDINAVDDGFAFLHQSITGDFSLVVRIDSFEAHHEWAKVGLMIRESLDADSPMILLNRFAENPAARMYRAAKGSRTTERAHPSFADANWLRMKREGRSITLQFSVDGRDWQTAEILESDHLAGLAFVGVALNASDGHIYSRAVISNLNLK